MSEFLKEIIEDCKLIPEGLRKTETIDVTFQQLLDLTAALQKAEESINKIKLKVIGEAANNNWPLGLAVTKNRGDIADLCDAALAAFDALGK